MSNIVLSYQSGVPITEIFKRQWNGYKELGDYRTTLREISKLKIKKYELLAIGKSAKHIVKKIEELNAELSRNSVHPLVSAGLFSTIVEDVNPDDVKHNSRLARRMGQIKDKSPKMISTALDYLYFTENTFVYKGMLEATQYSDFVARYGLYHSDIEKKTAKFEKEFKRKMTPAEVKKMQNETISVVRDTFINYNNLDNKFVKYANDMGLVMFTKFFLGIQKVLKRTASEKPVNFLAALVAQMAFVDLEDVTEHSLFTKSYGGIMHSPFDTIEHVVTPTLFEVPGLLSEASSGIYR